MKKICNARFLKGNSERGLKPHDGAYVGGLQDHDTKLPVQWEGLQTEINHLYEPNTEISQSFTFASVINHSPQILIARSLMRTNWKSDRSPRRQSMSRALKAGLFHTPHTKYEDQQTAEYSAMTTNKPQKTVLKKTGGTANEAPTQSKFLSALWFLGEHGGSLPSHWGEWFGPFCRRFVKAPSAHSRLKPCSRQDKCWPPSSWTFYSLKLRLNTAGKHKVRTAVTSLLTLECATATVPHTASTNQPSRFLSIPSK